MKGCVLSPIELRTGLLVLGLPVPNGTPIPVSIVRGAAPRSSNIWIRGGMLGGATTTPFE
jgi:hypothetical protein